METHFSSTFVKAHLAWYREIYRQCGIDAAVMAKQVSDTPQSAAILRRFLQLYAVPAISAAA